MKENQMAVELVESGEAPVTQQERKAGEIKKVERGELTEGEQEYAYSIHKRLTGRYWGLTKQQVELFLDTVKDCHEAGLIHCEKDQSKFTYYPESKFNNPKIGPNMYQVNTNVIMPMTKGTLMSSLLHALTHPGVSWALWMNPDGLECMLFVSHAWAEGAYEFRRSLMGAWPEQCNSVYICFLANPQNLDISKIIQGKPKDSPFGDALRGPLLTDVVMVANSNCAIHSRLWCVYEAFLAQELDKTVSVGGNTDNLVTSLGSVRLGQAIYAASFLGMWSIIFGITWVYWGQSVDFVFALTRGAVLGIILGVIVALVETFVAAPMQWNEIDPQKADCTSPTDERNIKAEIEEEPGTWTKIHEMMDKLIHSTPSPTGAPQLNYNSPDAKKRQLLSMVIFAVAYSFVFVAARLTIWCYALCIIAPVVILGLTVQALGHFGCISEETFAKIKETAYKVLPCLWNQENH